MACVAYGCKSHSSRKCDEDRKLTFHRFPDDEKIKEIWIKALHRKNWKPSQHSRLCSKHFTSQCYWEGKKRKNLCKDALPTIFKNYPIYLQKKSSKLAQSQILDSQRSLRVTQRNLQTSLDTRDSHPVQSPTSNELHEKTTVSSKSLSVPRLNATQRIKKLRKAMLKELIKSAQHLKKLKTVQQKCRKLKRKIIVLESIISKSKPNNYINDDSSQLLNHVGGVNTEFSKRSRIMSRDEKIYSDSDLFISSHIDVYVRKVSLPKWQKMA